MVSYILPLRRWRRVSDDALTDYLTWLSERVDLIVVDGSDPAIFADHHEKWGHMGRHVPVDPELVTPNGKVGGVLTGARLARGDRVIVADDDVRYDARALDRMDSWLETYDLVWPQNVYVPMTRTARWDTARVLLNRGLGWDFPGTVGLRSQAFERIGRYDGDVVFENLELLRTLKVERARIAVCRDMYVARLPPEPERLVSQQVRYAYESLAQPWRMAAELSILPTTLIVRRRPREAAALLLAAVICAMRGRRRDGGATMFPGSSALLVPPWLVVRGICSWLALVLAATGRGLPYGDARIWRAAHSTRTLRQARAAAHRRPPGSAPLVTNDEV